MSNPATQLDPTYSFGLFHGGQPIMSTMSLTVPAILELREVSSDGGQKILASVTVDERGLSSVVPYDGRLPKLTTKPADIDEAPSLTIIARAGTKDTVMLRTESDMTWSTVCCDPPTATHTALCIRDDGRSECTAALSPSYTLSWQNGGISYTMGAATGERKGILIPKRNGPL